VRNPHSQAARVSWNPVVTMDFLATILEVLEVERSVLGLVLITSFPDVSTFIFIFYEVSTLWRLVALRDFIACLIQLL
jgi:hypothetical protein